MVFVFIIVRDRAPLSLLARVSNPLEPRYFKVSDGTSVRNHRSEAIFNFFESRRSKIASLR